MSLKTENMWDRIKKKAKKEGFSQKYLAELAGVPESTLSFWIRNKSDIGINILREFAHHLGVDLVWLIYGKTTEERALNKRARKIIEKTNEKGQVTDRYEVTYDTTGIESLLERLLKLNPESREIISEMVDIYIKKQVDFVDDYIKKQGDNK